MDDVQDVRAAARPMATDADLDPLLERVGDAHIVMLGEASHGTHEFYEWRDRLTRRLVTDKGFSFVAVEGDWPDCHRLHRWITHDPNGPASLDEALRSYDRWPTWMWANTVVRDAAQWLHEHNAGRPAGERVGFHGLDVYSLWRSLREVVGWLRENEPDLVDTAVAAFRCFEPFGEDPQSYALATRFVPDSCEDRVLQVLQELCARGGEVDGDPDERFVTEQNAAVVAGAAARLDDRDARRVTLGVTGSVAGSITHQYNNLLMIVRTCAEFVHMDMSPDDPRREYIGRLLVAADRAAELTNQLQAFAIPAMRHEQELQPGRVLHGMAETLRRIVPENVDFRLSNRSSSTITCDPVQLQSLVLLLLSRAVEEVHAGGRISISLSEEIEAADDATSTVCVLTVVSRSEKTRRSRPVDLLQRRAGTGARDTLLLMAQEVGRENNAHLDARYDPERGTVVRVVFPCVAAAQQPRLVSPTRPRREIAGGSEVVLLVEDDTVVRWTVREILERYGYTVFDAANGSDALRVLDMLSAPPDLVLTDLIMPEVSGSDLVHTLRAENRVNKVLLMSGYADDQHLRRTGALGALPLLRKPFTPEVLALRVREVLDSD